MVELLAAYPGLDPSRLGEMDPGFLLGLWANIPKVEALRELESRRADSPMTAARLYDLKWAATGNEREAEEAARRFMAAQLRAGQTPD